MFAITETNRAKLEQFYFIQSVLLTNKMLTHKLECLQKREQILQKKKHYVFLFIRILIIVSQKRGRSILLHYISQLACKSVNFLIGQLLMEAWWTHVFPVLNAKQILSGRRPKSLKIYRITTVLIKMNVLSNLSDSEFSIGHGFVKGHDAA